jgi:hypothetical protein
MKKLLTLTTSLAITLGATSAFGNLSLQLIPTLGDSSSQARAITPDGQYVVGVSGSGTTARGFLWQSGSGSAINVLSGDGAQSTAATGVGYRTYAGNTELIIAGLSSGYVTEFMTANGGATFGVKRRNTSYTLNTQSGMNQLGSPGNTDQYFVTSRNSTQLQLDINRGSGAWPATILTSPKSVSTQARMIGIGATGAAVGSRVNGSVRSNYRMDFNPAGSPFNAYFNGLNTVAGQTQQGEAFDVSDDGKYVTGWSGLGTDSANSYAYKAIFSGTTWQSTFQLPVTGLETGSTAKTVAYGISPDGRWIGGGSYQGAYHAILWDTQDANPANWIYYDLTQYATAHGLLDGWTSLQRVFSIGIDPVTGDPIVTGEGVYGGVARAFLMQIPEPTTLTLAGLGLAALLVIRRRK